MMYLLVDRILSHRFKKRKNVSTCVWVANKTYRDVFVDHKLLLINKGTLFEQSVKLYLIEGDSFVAFYQNFELSVVIPNSKVYLVDPNCAIV